MSDPAVNHFKIRRAAHNLSRQSSNGSFNPFAHVAWGQKRRQTFADDRDLEQGGGGGDDGSPISHIHTAPELCGPGVLTEDGKEGRLSKDDESPGAEGDGEHASGDSVLAPHASTAEGASLKRRQRGGQNAETGTAPDGHGEHKGESEGKKEKKDSRFLKHIKPKEPFTVVNQLQRTFLNSWINVLLIAAPIGIALNFTKVTPIVIFVVNFIAIIPLAAMLSFATEEIALRTGETLGGLLNATFGYGPGPSLLDPLLAGKELTESSGTPSSSSWPSWR